MAYVSYKSFTDTQSQYLHLFSNDADIFVTNNLQDRFTITFNQARSCAVHMGNCPKLMAI